MVLAVSYSVATLYLNPHGSSSVLGADLAGVFIPPDKVVDCYCGPILCGIISTGDHNGTPR